MLISNIFTLPEDIANGVASFFFSILLFIDGMVYSLVGWVYKIILVLCQVNILGNDFEINGLVNRIYVIVGVVVLFLVAYSLLKSMVNPDEALKGKKSPVKIISNVVISIVLVAVVPYIFEFANGFQRALLTRNTLGNLILGSTINVDNATVDSTSLINEGGNAIAAGVLQAFIHPKYSECTQVGVSKDNPTGYDCSGIVLENGNNFDVFFANITASGDFTLLTDLNKDVVLSGNITYYFLISTVAGVFVLFVLLQYCFDLALRSIKLAVYQLIAPLPILSRLLPGEQGEKVFSNWIKACLSTFLEVFIRLAILFFAVLLIKIVIQNFPNLFGAFNGEASIVVTLFAEMFIVVGIVLFIKQAPEIIKEITGLDGGKYNVFKSAMQTAAMIGGGATAAVRNFNDAKKPDGSNKNLFNRFRSAVGGAGSGAFRSTWNRDNVKDFKSMKENATNSAKKAIDAHNKRVARTARYKSTKDNRFTDMRDIIKEWSGASNSREVLEAKKKLYDQGVGFQKQLFDLAADDKTVLALEGQKKAASEKIIDKDAIEKEIRDRMANQIRNQISSDPSIPTQIVELEVERQLDLAKDQIAQETSSTMAQRRKDQASTIDMYDNLIKVAKLRTINEKINKGDGRYTSIVETAKVFKSQHMNDETIASMKDISISDEQAKQLERILDLNDPDAVTNQMDIIKGKRSAGPNDIMKSKIDLMVDNDNFKIASGDVSTQIARLVQEEKGKEAEKK